MTRIAVPQRPKPQLPPRAITGPTFKKFEYATLDFETEAIDLRPAYPPKPVSASLKLPGERKATFYAWGHPVGNNCTQEQFGRRLKDLWKGKLPVVAQHGKFDHEVAHQHFNLPLLPWERCHDTEFLIFLHDPHAMHLALKESAHRILGIQPDERDELRDWIFANIPEAKKRKSEWGRFISQAPASLVGPYANGDIFRTEKLLNHLLPEIHKRDMVAAYNRERRVMPIFLRNEREGIRVDINQLEKDFVMYQKALVHADQWLCKQLKCPDLNLDADLQVAEALDNAGVVSEWTWTKGGRNKAPQRSVSKKNLTIDHFTNRKIALVYAYRNRLRTCLSMFMESWLRMGKAMGGTLNTEWNQTRQDRNGGLVGTRTGRPSTSNPNFLNVSKSFLDKDDGYVHPKFLAQLPPLPLMRNYLLPDKGEVWGHRDFNQQELRMLAEYEDGGLKRRYCEKPYRNLDGSMRFDIHSTVQKGLLEIAKLKLSRTGVKIVNFSDIYGKGEVNLAESLGLDIPTIKLVKAAKNELMPDVAKLISDIKTRGKQGLPIRTWGGREYYCEKPAFVKKFNREMTFEYKLINYLIQPSSADVTKEALIRYDEHPKREARFLVTVYDEINSSMPAKRLDTEMRVLRESMESIETEVPMLSDGKTGDRWAAIKGYKGKAELEEWVVNGDKWWL